MEETMEMTSTRLYPTRSIASRAETLQSQQRYDRYEPTMMQQVSIHQNFDTNNKDHASTMDILGR